MAITPSTNLKLLKVPIALDNKNQLTFSNEQAQYNYFNSLPSTTLIEDSYYQRRDSYIEFPQHIDTLIEYNYCMYQNENYTNKWFYAYITNMLYINDGLTRIYIATDVFQTWQFDLTWKQSFVTREMISVNEDLPGNNLQPEGLETGEYKVGGTADYDELNPICIVVYTRNPQEDGLTNQQPTALGVIANGIPNGMFMCIVSIDMLQGLLSTINSSGHGDAIMTIFTVPALALDGFNNLSIQDLQNGVLLWFVTDFKADPIIKNLVSTPDNLDGYIPRNQKLRAYPYMYVGFNPPNGSSKIFRYEDFANGTPSFKMCSEINQNPSVAIIPQNYRGANGDALSDAVHLSGYPTIGWITEYYNTWLAQNSNIIDINMQQEQYNYNQNNALTKAENTMGAIGTILGSIGSASSGNFGGALSSAYNEGVNIGFSQERLKMQEQNHAFYVNMQMAIKEQQQMLPNKGNLSSSNATLLGYGMLSRNIFTRYTIKNQFAIKIDKYFDMYGYLTNELKIPNTNNRPNWNYVKTEGANIIADIPQDDLQIIKEIFNNGVTLWHNTNTFLDYSQNNR